MKKYENFCRALQNYIIKDSREKYIAMFEDLQKEIEANWL